MLKEIFKNNTMKKNYEKYERNTYKIKNRNKKNIEKNTKVNTKVLFLKNSENF